MNTFPITLYTLCSRYPNRRALGTREYSEGGRRGAYEWYSYTDFARQVILLVKGLEKVGVKPEDKVGIVSPNRTEWTVLEFACGTLGACMVPLYDTQTAEDLEYVAKDSGISIALCSLDRLHKAASLSVDVYVFDDRLDDRVYLQNNEAKVAGLPKRLLAQPRPFEVFDELDKAEGIADPGTRDTSLKPLRSSKGQDGFFAYLPEGVTEIGRYAQAAEHLGLIRGTYHGLLLAGYEALGLSGDKNQYEDIRPADHADLFQRATPGELSSLVYTSGTTGKPKGAILTQGNIIWTAHSMRIRRLIPEESPLNNKG